MKGKEESDILIETINNTMIDEMTGAITKQ
jgi:hypothetical protein